MPPWPGIRPALRRSRRCVAGCEYPGPVFTNGSPVRQRGREKEGELKLLIAKAFEDSDGTYGYRRIALQLARWGVQAGLELVRALMRELGLVACQPRPWRPSTTKQGQAGPIPDLVARDFSAAVPGRKWSVILLTSRHGKDGFTSRRSSTARHAKSPGGRWMITTGRRSSRRRSRWLPGTLIFPLMPYFIPIAAATILPPSSPPSWNGWDPPVSRPYRHLFRQCAR